MTTIRELKQLYEIDEQEWLETIINLLKNKRFENLDLDNLIEELEELVREKKML